MAKAKEMMVKFFSDMGMSAEEAGQLADEAMDNIQQAVSDAMSSVSSDAEALEVLKDAIGDIAEEADQLDDGPLKDYFKGITEGMEDAMRELESVENAEPPFEQLEEKTVSARQAMRDMREELIQMKLRGEENTEAYQQLLDKMGQLQDVMGDAATATKHMASDTAQLDTVMGGAQLAAGGLSAAMGAMNLIGAGEDTKMLAEAQKKLQAVIAITTGLQSIQNALQKESALMLGIQRAKTLAVAEAEKIKNAVMKTGVATTKAATAAQSELNSTVSKHPYALLTVAIFSGIAALTKWLMYEREVEQQVKKTVLALSNELAIRERLVAITSGQLEALNEGYAKIDEDFATTGNIEKYRKDITDLQFQESMAFEQMIKDDDYLASHYITNSQMVETELKNHRQIIDDERKKIEEYEQEGRNYLTGEYRRLKDINEANEKIRKSEEALEHLTPYYQKAEEMRKKHNDKLAELASEEYEVKQKEVQDARAMQDAKIAAMKDGYAKEIATIKSSRAAEREAMQAQLDNPNSGLTVAEKERIKERIRESENIENAEIAEVARRQKEAVKKAEEDLSAAEYELAQKRIERRNKQRQVEIDLMEEGSTRELAQMRHDHQMRIDEIEKEAKEESDAMREANKNNWLNEQRRLGKTVSDADWYASSVYKSLAGGLTDDQHRQIVEQRKRDTDNENALFAKKNKDFLHKMLTDYGDFEAQKKDIQSKYYSDISAAMVGMLTATTEEEKKAYADLTKHISKNNARALFELDMATTEATAYLTVDEKMDAINKVYDDYINRLKEAGASQAEINAAIAEQVEQTGKLTRLEAERADLEARIRNIQNGGLDREGLSLAELIERLAKVNKAIESATQKSFKELWDENKNQVVADSIDQVAEALTRLAEATGSLNAEQAARFMTSLSKGLKGFQQGGFIGVLVAGIEDTIAQITDAIVAGEALESSLKQAQVDKWREDVAAMMNQGKGGIFGADTIDNLNGIVAVLEESRKKMADFNQEQHFAMMDFNRALEATNLLSWRNWADMFGAETRNNVKAYFEAIEKGYSDVEAHVLRTRDRGWLFNFFGADDKYNNVKDIVEGLGYELYDQYNNLNADALRAILDTYTELSEEDRKWLEEAIAYSDSYAEAMEGVASYLQNLFGSVADTLADQLIESFLEGGEAAMDFGKVTSDVARNMAKDFIKNMLLTEVFNKYADQMKAIMMGNGTMEEKQQLMLSYFTAMRADAEALQPAIQAYLQGMSQFFGASDDINDNVMSGNLLQSASQDSVDLLNGQLNAIRVNQALTTNRIDDVLLQLSGIRTDMNNGLGQSVRHLESIDRNTSSGGSILSQLGIWLG